MSSIASSFIVKATKINIQLMLRKKQEKLFVHNIYVFNSLVKTKTSLCFLKTLITYLTFYFVLRYSAIYSVIWYACIYLKKYMRSIYFNTFKYIWGLLTESRTNKNNNIMLYKISFIQKFVDSITLKSLPNSTETKVLPNIYFGRIH